MKPSIALLISVCALAAGAGGGYWFGHRGATAEAPEHESTPESAKGSESKPAAIATVQVASIRRGVLSRQITAYGTVTVPPGDVRVTSVPFESRVSRILVAAGQTVSADEPLIEVEASAATTFALEEAQNALDAADRDLDLARKRYDQKLATNTELFAAQTAQKSAQSKLRNLQQNGAGGPRQLKADAAGIVDKIDVQIGQVVPIGGPLVEIAAGNRIEVKLGVEPKDAVLIKPGSTARLHRIDDPDSAEVEAKVRLISNRIDPVSRLVDVNASLPPDARWMLQGAVAGEMTVDSADGLIVPREAVLPDDSGQYSLFTAADGVAARHAVKLGIQNDKEVQISADGINAGDSVIIVGNFELDDGAKVVVETAAPATESTQPSTTPASQPEAEDRK